MQTYAVIGAPVMHSLSPTIHNALYALWGMDCKYIPLEIRIDQLAAFFNTREERGLSGMNVTMPLKRAVIPYLDALHPDAALTGSVNTIAVRPEGLYGCSTDGDGLVRAVTRAGWRPDGRDVMIYGAGAVTPAIALALARAGAERICLVNRTRERAEAVAALLEGTVAHVFLPAQGEEAATAEACSLFLNATPLGMQGFAPFSDWTLVDALPRTALVYDLLYAPRETALLAHARARGLAGENGLSMLVEQALLSFFVWFGRDASDAYDAVFRLCLQALPGA